MMSFGFSTKFYFIFLFYSISNHSNCSAQENLEVEETASSQICGFGEKCVRKCCDEGTLFSNYECINESTTATAWKPPAGIYTNFTVLHGLPSGSNDDHCGEVQKEDYKLSENSGKVLYMEMGKEYGLSLYCIENNYNDETKEVTEIAVICYQISRKDNFDHWTDSFHKIALSFSVICLSVILVLYATSPGKNELKVQSKCIISSCFSLLVAFVLVLINMTKQATESFSHVPCVVIAIVLQYFFLSFYFWLNAMIYDIARIIRGTMNLQRMASLEKKRLRYAIYALYAWGCPAIISIVTVIMQVESKNIGESVIKPHIGEGRCWFKEDGGSIYAYYYGIEVFLHLINAGLIIHSLYLLKGQAWLQKLRCGERGNIAHFNMRSHATKNHYDFFWTQFSTYILYICVWIMNSVTLIYSREKFWRIIDIAVSLQGVFLLIIVVKFGNNLFLKAWNKLKKATSSLTASTNSFDLTELSSHKQTSDTSSNEQIFHKVSER